MVTFATLIPIKSLVEQTIFVSVPNKIEMEARYIQFQWVFKTMKVSIISLLQSLRMLDNLQRFEHGGN